MLPEGLRKNPTAAALAELATGGKIEFGELTNEVAPSSIPTPLGRLKRDLNFETLAPTPGVDRYPAEPRFELVYHLQSVPRKERIRLKTRVRGENPEIASAVQVYRAADWYERETFDFFGV